MLKTLMFIGLFAFASSKQHRETSRKQLSKRSFDCPLNFVKLGRKCYFVSQEELPWQEAYFSCESMKSQMAIVKNQNQDKLIRTALSKIEPKEYWIGGRYNWQKKQWKWARSGKLLTYEGFDPLIRYTDQEMLKWSCISLDPELFYRWSAKSCLEPKRFICHKNLKNSNRKQKKTKLEKSYGLRNGYNEIPVPQTSNDLTDEPPKPKDLYQVDLNNDLGNNLYNFRSKRKNNRKNKTHRTQNSQPSHSQLSHVGQYSNGTVYEQPDPPREPPKQSEQLNQSENLQRYQMYKRLSRQNVSKIT